jgi:mannose-6-phosphate isomerase-like protein (cupin superfamily)
MVEAMACGTPVIAYPRGSVPEIIKHGETGFIVSSLDGAVEALSLAPGLDPQRLRRYVEERFSRERMIEDYIRVYEEVLRMEQADPKNPSSETQNPKFDQRPWGSFTVLDEADGYKVKRIEVLPHKRLSYQRHSRRAEHWMVVQGTAKVTLDGREALVRVGETADVPVGTAHRVENPGDERLVFIEVQRGDYLGEDDIVRLEDDFGRN